MSMPFVSIVIPVYNTGLYLEAAIQGVLNQTYTNFELIIIDDGSTDDSPSIIRSFSDNRIRLYSNERNLGIVFSRNLGLQLSAGKYIGMVDADDVVAPEKLEKQVAFLEEHSAFGLVGSWVKFIDSKGKPLSGKWKLPASPEEIPSIMLFHNYFVQSSVLIRKDCLSGFKFSEDFPTAQDYLMWVNVMDISKAWNLPEYLVLYRKHFGGITEKHKKIRAVKEKEIFKIQLKKLNIIPTEEELDCHLLIKNNIPISDISQLKAIENWLLKIVEQNNRIRAYNHVALMKIIMDRWVKVCFKARSLHFKTIYVFLFSTVVKTFIYKRVNS